MESQLGVSTIESQLGDMTWSFANQGRRFQIWHFRLEILIPWPPLAPKFPNFAIQILLFRSKHSVAVVTHAHVLQNFHTTWVRGVACQKQRLGPKLEGAALWKHPKNLGPPYVFLQPLKLATLNLVHNLGLGLAYQKTTFRTNIGGALARVTSKTNLGPLHIFATVEASNFKFGTQIGFGTSLPKMTFKTKVGGVWAKGASKNNLGPPTYFCNR